MQWLRTDAAMRFYRQHYDKWAYCRRCDLWKLRRETVLFRGYIPADVLFVGEAPGAMEDLMGVPFVGPAGDILDLMISQIRKALKLDEFFFCVSNIVACMPPYREPAEAEVKECDGRLRELINAVDPKVIVAVGRISQSRLIAAGPNNYSRKLRKIVSVIHPAAILRQPDHLRAVAIRRQIATIVCAIEESEVE